MALATNLVSHWKFDESSGNAADSVGSNTATNSNVTYTSGKINNCASFNGTSSKFTLASNPVTGASARTVSVWIKPDSSAYTGLRTIYSTGTAGSATHFDIYTNVNSTDDVYIGFGSADLYSATGVIKRGSWNHIIVTYAGGILTTANIKLYVNGIGISLSGGSGAYTANTGTGGSIGIDETGTGRFFFGLIDEVSAWSRALSADEVSQLFNSGRANSYPFTDTPSLYGCVASYNLDESSGNAADNVSIFTLTNVGLMPYSTAKINNGAAPDGTNRMLAIQSNIGYIGGSQSYSWNGWIYTANFNAYYIQHRTSSGANRNFILYGGNDSKIHAFCAGNEIISGVLSINTWYMVTVVKTGTTYEMFINGVSQGTATEGTSGTAVNCFVIGANTNDGSTVAGSPMTGKMDMWTLWNKSISASERSLLYNSTAGLAYPWTASSPSFRGHPLINLIPQGQLW